MPVIFLLFIFIIFDQYEIQDHICLKKKLPVMIRSSLVSFSVISTGTPSMILVYFLIIGSEIGEENAFDLSPYGI